MKLTAKQYIAIAFLIALILFTGYYRDYLFKNINAVIQSKQYNEQYTTLPSSLYFLNSFGFQTLVNLKWLLTIVFSAVYLILSLLTLKIIFDKRRYYLITSGVYLTLILISGMFILTGYLFNGISDRMYEFARYLMGMAQSPIILMILIPAFKLSRPEHNHNTN
ncbi:MAG TPA: hypothetical protein VLB84_12850 [Bacteroidia bacterium]|nr:hypothetical protein [Bacteroidia bacterium]